MATSKQTPYEILGVPENINYVELRRFYRTKIHEHKQKKISVVNFRHICRAYETLSDFDKRNRYDTQKEWTFELLITKYTPQQLAAEPDLIDTLKQRLLNANLTKINGQDPITGHTTLYCAARAGNIEAVKFLTEQGAEPDLSQRTKSTALHVASFYGHADVVQCLLESGADYRIKNALGNTAENEAYNDDVKRIFTELKQIAYVRMAADELDWFLKNGLTQHQDKEYFSQRQTLLHCACKKGHIDLVRWLVEQRSAYLDLVDFNGNSALHLAAYGGHFTIVEYLLNRGCNSTLQNRWGTTAEEEGSIHGNNITKIFKSMRERDMFEMARTGVDWWFNYYFDDKSSDMIDSKGISLLYYACRFGHYSLAKWLLKHGANINMQMKTEPKSTSLHAAKYYGHFSIVELLLEYGADVNIKNDYELNVFNEDIHKEVNKNSANKIKEILLQYQQNLKSDKLIDIYVYEDDGNTDEPIAKIKLEFTSKYKDLLTALSNVTDDQYPHFSVARRALLFMEEDTTIISAVCSARYSSSKFIDTPIRLIRHKTLPMSCTNSQPNRQNSNLNLQDFTKNFDNKSKTTSFSLKSPLTKKQNINVGNLMFTFSEGCISKDIQFKVITIFLPDPQIFDIPGCICLFKIDLGRHTSHLVELPVVSIVNEPHARLYTFVTPLSYWFSSDIRPTHLPMIGGIHAFVRHVDIIPKHLILPADMFIANAHEQPLKSRNKPVPCTCLLLRNQDIRTFPHVAYHGTNINAVRSILFDSLVVPGTVVSSGKRINPPSNHFSRDKIYFNIPNFADAVFLSPSIHYSSDPLYAVAFSHNDQQLIPVLECSVKSNSYVTNRSTVPFYTKQPDDDINAIEWRVIDPRNIEINAVLFITKNKSNTESINTRMTKITSSSTCLTS